jgi:hypothetical protein
MHPDNIAKQEQSDDEESIIEKLTSNDAKDKKKNQKLKTNLKNKVNLEKNLSKKDLLIVKLEQNLG